jgi:hypothetical protein
MVQAPYTHVLGEVGEALPGEAVEPEATVKVLPQSKTPGGTSIFFHDITAFAAIV